MRDFDAEEYPRKDALHSYDCYGGAHIDGPCGRPDCVTCGRKEKDEDNEERVEEELASRVRVRRVTVRKSRFAGTYREIKVGDRVEVRSWFTYEEKGPRTGYSHVYTRIAKGPAWDN